MTCSRKSKKPRSLSEGSKRRTKGTEGRGHMTTKCSVGSWIESWNRKRMLVEKLEKSEIRIRFLI